jgi:hypothetical protein
MVFLYGRFLFMKQLLLFSLIVASLPMMQACGNGSGHWVELAGSDRTLYLSPTRAELRRFIQGLGKVDIPDDKNPAVGAESTTIGEVDGIPSRITTQKKSITRSFESVAAFDPNADVLWAGSIVQGRSIESGVLAPIALSRKPGTVTVKNLTMEGSSAEYSRSIENPTNATLQKAVMDIVTQKLPIHSGALISYESATYSSVDQGLLQMGVSAKWLSASAKASISAEQSIKSSNMIVRLTQAYYSASFSPPSAPEAFFTDNVSVDDAALYMSPKNGKVRSNPPVYVSTVTYGRSLYFLISSNEESSRLKAAVESSFKIGIVNGDANVAAERQRIIQDSDIRVLVLGGSGSSAVNVLTGDKVAGIEKLLREGADYSPSSPGVPISYQLRYLKDNDVARLSLTTEYDDRRVTPIGIKQLLVTFNTMDDDKDKEEVLDAWAYLGGRELFHSTFSDGETWNDHTTRQLAFAMPAGVTYDQVKKMSFRLRKNPVGSEHGKGWRVAIEIKALLEDGRQMLVLPSTGRMQLGEGQEFDLRWALNQSRR